jgi:diguanylate cyclase (GGDEF)-like protein
LSEPHEKPAESGDPGVILSALDAVVYDWDIASDRILWGANAGAVLRGLPREGLATGEGFAGIVTADSDASRYLAIFNGLSSDEGQGAPFRVQYRLAAPGVAAMAIEDIGRWFADEHGRPCRAHGLMRVVSRAPAPETTLDREDNTLCSRRAFNAWVDGKCEEPRAPESSLSLMVVGVGAAAEVNRRHGYDVGDELIMGVGRRLAQRLRGGDKLVRYAGAKFALLVALGPKDSASIAAARILGRANAEPYATSTGPLPAKARVGVALSPRHGRNAHLLLQRADEAFALTSDGPDAVAIYAANEALAEQRRREAWIADEIVSGLNERRVLLAFQPVRSTRAELPSFEEALVRLQLDDGTLLGPDALIPVAERLGLIELLDERVLELTLQQLVGDPVRRLSMNLSIATLRAPDWLDRLRDHLAANPGAAERLTLEIVETQAIEDAEALARVVSGLKALGVRIAMDDFGAGHTSFRNLRALGVDMVKIDGAFVQNLAASVDDRFFVRTLASLARHLGILTVAEWVEDEESGRLLAEWGVDFLQGHHIGRAEAPQPSPAPNRVKSA